MTTWGQADLARLWLEDRDHRAELQAIKAGLLKPSQPDPCLPDDQASAKSFLTQLLRESAGCGLVPLDPSQEGFPVNQTQFMHLFSLNVEWPLTPVER